PRRTRPETDEAAHPARTAAGPIAHGPFPASRGLVFGALAGLIVGGVEAGLFLAMGSTLSSLSPLAEQILAPVPLTAMMADLFGLSGIAMRVLLPGVLGAIAGFIAAAAGSPNRVDRPLRPMRAAGFALLAGLACGLTVSLSAGEGLKIWPVANWMRDL